MTREDVRNLLLEVLSAEFETRERIERLDELFPVVTEPVDYPPPLGTCPGIRVLFEDGSTFYLLIQRG